jgi:hypothetical protein
MIRAALSIGSMTVLGLALFANTHADTSLNRVEGLRISGRLPCDGATNPQEELRLKTTFSPGGWQRSFHLDVFEKQYCKRVDLYFFCLSHGHERWKKEWISSSENLAAPARYWMDTCTSWGEKDAPEYILSGWYQEGAGKKLEWKQAAIKKTSETPEVYEFSDPQGGTARIEIKRN